MTRRNTLSRVDRMGKFDYTAVSDWAQTYRVRDWYDGKLIGTVTRVASRTFPVSPSTSSNSASTKRAYQSI